MVLITTLKNDQGIAGTVADSSAATTSSAYYVRDIESAGAVTTTSSPSSSPAPCSAAGLGGTPTFLLGLQLQGTTPAAEVSYYEWTPAGSAPELVREFCANGSSTPQSHEILSDDLSTSDPPTPVVGCASPTPTSIPTGVTCSPGTNWAFTYMVSTVTLNVTQGCSTVGSCAQYQFALSGAPQSGVPIPPVNQPCGVLTLLGTGNDINLGGSFVGSEQVNVQGPIALNSGYNTSGGNPAISSGFSLFSSESVNATSTSSCANVPAADAIGIYNCDNTSSSGASTNFQACPTSGQHSSINDITVSPDPPVQISTGANQTGLTDPLLSWANQNPVANITSTGSCTGTSTLKTCSPGLYPSGLGIANGVTVNFQAGNYQFGGSVGCSGSQTSLCIQSNDTVNFGTGHYTYTNGIDVAGSGSALCGSATATAVCTHPIGGVFFYVKGGSTNLGNYFASNTIQLSAITNSADPYQNVVLWQDGGDPNNTLVLSSPNSNATNTLAGEIYAPTAQVFINGYGGNVATQDIVANTLAFGGTAFNNLTLTVSPAP